MAQKVSLPEFVSFAQEAKEKPVIHFSESEVPTDDVNLGDEDTTTGSGLRLKVQLKMDNPDVIYEKTYDDEEEYETDMQLINQLKGES